MQAKERLALLLPAALNASRSNTLFEHIPPLVNNLWAEADEGLPFPVRCAWVESEVLKRAPLSISPGELLAGRLDNRAPIPELLSEKARNPFPGGQKAHTALDANKLLTKGITGIEAEIRENSATAKEEGIRVFYESALISLDGFRKLAGRLKNIAYEAVQAADTEWQRAEMARLAGVLERVPEYPAKSFYEAIQATHLLYFAASLTVQSLYGPGRMDRILFPYFKSDIESGIITRDEALQLICCLFILMNHVFSLPQPLMIGGLDENGHDSTNDLTHLCLEADRLVGLVNPSLGIGVNKETPNELLTKAADRLLSGSTKPALFNDHTIIAGLEKLGVPYKDAVDYTHSTCVEITIAAKSNILVASPYINLLKPLEFMLNDGKPLIGTENTHDINGYASICPPDPASYACFDDFFREYKRQLSSKIADAARMMGNIRRQRVDKWVFPFVSCFTDDCLARGIDVDRGGARYNWTETSNVGLANITDSLIVIKRRVFEGKQYTLQQIKEMLLSDFSDEKDRLKLISGMPKYGNDNKEADMIAAEIVDTIYKEHWNHKDALGGHFVPGFFCWIMHRILGGQTAASPDGRRMGEVLADAAGAAQGRDRNGPTAAIRSITSWDHKPGLGGIVLNLRFSPQNFSDANSKDRLVDIIRTYFDLGGFEVQINSVDSETLRTAQKEPEKYADLLVRVAGYSDYFTLLDSKMQDEIIKRTEHNV